MKLRSVEAAYENNGIIYSAWQRQEIVELDTGTKRVEVIGKWTDYEVARAEVKAFNKEQRENTSNR